MSIYERFIGRRVIVRAHMAGTYVGICTEAHADGVTLAPGWRHMHYWSAGGSTAQIAERGIAHEGSRLTTPGSAPKLLAGGAHVVDVCIMTDAAWDQVMACPEWHGGLV